VSHFVTGACVNCKYTTCVTVCPVDCFYEGENMLVINPEECIDCGVCIPECPAKAIFPDTEGDPGEIAKWIEVNSKYSKQWPKITKEKSAMHDAEKFLEVPNKFETFFRDR
jgi:ferredoxin